MFLFRKAFFKSLSHLHPHPKTLRGSGHSTQPLKTRDCSVAPTSIMLACPPHSPFYSAKTLILVAKQPMLGVQVGHPSSEHRKGKVGETVLRTLHFIDGYTEAQRGQWTWARLHSQLVPPVSDDPPGQQTLRIPFPSPHPHQVKHPVGSSHTKGTFLGGSRLPRHRFRMPSDEAQRLWHWLVRIQVPAPPFTSHMLWASDLSVLCLCFLICKMGEMLVAQRIKRLPAMQKTRV